MNPEQKFFIIDGHSYSFQAYYAIGSLQTPSGMYVGAAYVFTLLIERLLGESPSHLAVIFDAPGKTFRSIQYPDYKIQRQPMPEEMASQMPMIKEILAAYGIPVIELPGYEADDVIATLARRASREGIPTYIVSNDKDLEQLIDDRRVPL